MIADRTTLSIAKAGELVGVTRRTIYNWIAGGKVEYVRTAGGSVRIFVDTTVARSACLRHPAGYARNLGRRLNTLRGLNVALLRLPAPLRRASPVPWSGAPPQAATRGFRTVRPPREPGRDAAQVDRIPVIGPRATPLPPESKGNGLRLAGEPSLGLQSEPMAALGRAGRIERLTIIERPQAGRCLGSVAHS